MLTAVHCLMGRGRENQLPSDRRGQKIQRRRKGEKYVVMTSEHVLTHCSPEVLSLHTLNHLLIFTFLLCICLKAGNFGGNFILAV